MKRSAVIFVAGIALFAGCETNSSNSGSSGAPKTESPRVVNFVNGVIGKDIVDTIEKFSHAAAIHYIKSVNLQNREPLAQSALFGASTALQKRAASSARASALDAQKIAASAVLDGGAALEPVMHFGLEKSLYMVKTEGQYAWDGQENFQNRQWQDELSQRCDR